MVYKSATQGKMIRYSVAGDPKKISYSVIVGGRDNQVSIATAAYDSRQSFIGGGNGHRIRGVTSTANQNFIGGGAFHCIIDAKVSGIVAGDGSRIYSLSHASFIGGGGGHTLAAPGVNFGNRVFAGANYGFIGAGRCNIMGDTAGGGNTAWFGTIVSGYRNQIDATGGTSDFGFIGGGNNNTILPGSNASAILGGSVNTASNGLSTIGGGFGNYAINTLAAVVGGNGNQATGFGSFVGSGMGNFSTGYASVIGGGVANVAGGDYSVVGGGYNNVVTGAYSAILGGANNNDNGLAYVGIFGNNINNPANMSANTFHVNCLNAINTPNVAAGPFPPGSIFWKAFSALNAGDKVLVIQ